MCEVHGCQSTHHSFDAVSETYLCNRHQADRQRETRLQIDTSTPLNNCEITGCDSPRHHFDAVSKRYLCQRHLEERQQSTRLQSNSFAFPPATTSSTTPQEENGAQPATTRAPESAGGGGPRTALPLTHEGGSVEALRAFRRWKLTHQRTEYQRLDPFIPREIQDGEVTNIARIWRARQVRIAVKQLRQ